VFKLASDDSLLWSLFFDDFLFFDFDFLDLFEFFELDLRGLFSDLFGDDTGVAISGEEGVLNVDAARCGNGCRRSFFCLCLRLVIVL